MHSNCSSCKDWVKFRSLQGVFFYFGYEHARSKNLFAKFCNRSGGSLKPVEYTRH